MSHLSVRTFARALSVPRDARAPINLGEAAGDYENTVCTEVAKGVVGVLTVGVGYLLIRALEECLNVRPKIREFRQAASALYDEIKRAPKQLGERARVSIQVGHKTMTFDEHPDGVAISGDAKIWCFLQGETLTSIKDKIGQDFRDNPAAYAHLRGAQYEPPEAPNARFEPFFTIESAKDFGSFLDSPSKPRAPADVSFLASQASDPCWAFEQRFDALTPVAQQSLKRCVALHEFVPRALTFLSQYDNRPFSRDVADFLRGTSRTRRLPEELASARAALPIEVFLGDPGSEEGRASPLPAGLEPPRGAIPVEVKLILDELLRPTAQWILEKGEPFNESFKRLEALREKLDTSDDEGALADPGSDFYSGSDENVKFRRMTS